MRREVWSAPAAVRRRVLDETWAAMARTTQSTLLRRAMEDERLGGAAMLLAAVAALVVANSPLRDGYHQLLDATFGPGPWHLSVEAWATEGLLALFFFVVGTELAREFRVGALRDRRRAALPMIAAVGGMVVPAVVYTVVVSVTGTSAHHGWAIPTATDIAFALAVLAVAGRGLPSGVRMFLLTLAVVDDLLGIVVVAVFYTADLDLWALAGGVAAVAVFALLVRQRWARWWSLLPVALVTWAAVQASGVPPAVAGAVLGLTVPAVPLHGQRRGRAVQYEEALRPVATWVALPLFAFCATGVTVGAEGDPAAVPVMVAVAAGLALGKPVGVLGATVLATRFGTLRLPRGVETRDLLPVGLLTGIGFTVALLVSHLSFVDDAALTDAGTLGVLLGSALACLGAVVGLRLRVRRIQTPSRR